MEKRMLLLVEDNEMNRQFLCHILEDSYQILFASNGQEGLEILKEQAHNISAILLDLQMPVMNGFEFLERVAKDAGYSDIPIIVTTILDSVSEEKRCLELGAVDFIVKPYHPLLVRLRVDNVIQLRECNKIITDLEMDALTGFKTRKAYYHDIDVIEHDARSRERSAGVVFMDINGLKTINDNLGHRAGDELIGAVAKTVSAVFPEAQKYRFGGDEFVILVQEESEESFNRKLKKLKALWGNRYSAAVGSVWLEHAQELEKNVAIADQRMYQDKSRYYENKMQERRWASAVETEETLKKVESVSELLPGGFFVYHADGDEQLITYNQELLKLFKCKDEQEFLELTGNSFKGMVHPDDLNIVECNISSQIQQEKDIDKVKYRILCKDGTEKTVLDYGRFVHTELYGDVYYVFMNDVTEEE